MYGTLVINEHALPITRIELKDGKVLVTAYTAVKARMHLPHGAEFRIQGLDGSLITTGMFMNHGEDLKVRPDRDTDLTVIQPLGFLGKSTVPVPD